MPSPHLLLAFFVTTAIFAFIPGPAMLYAAARTLAEGRQAGLMASFGIHLGGYVHVLAAAAGLSILFTTVPILFLAVRLGGALYLVWLGLALFRGAARADTDLAAIRQRPVRRPLVQSIAVEVLNPKTALFFLAFLPQFIDASVGTAVWLPFLVLGTIVNLMFSSADIACVLLASAIMSRLRRSTWVRRLMQRAGGTVLVGLGAHLALNRG